MTSKAIEETVDAFMVLADAYAFTEGNGGDITESRAELKFTLLAELDRIKRVASDAPAELKHWCETCEGLGTIDETLGGEHFSNPKAQCPDCDGKGYWIRAAGVASDAPGVEARWRPISEFTQGPDDVVLRWMIATDNTVIGDCYYGFGAWTHPAVQDEPQTKAWRYTANSRRVPEHLQPEYFQPLSEVPSKALAPSGVAEVPEESYNGEEWEMLAMALAREEHEDIHYLIWEGGPVPEPWGEVWQKYEDEARRMIALVRENAPPRGSVGGDDLHGAIREGMERAAKIVDDADVVECRRNTYYAQLGDARATLLAAAKEIREAAASLATTAPQGDAKDAG